MKAVVLEIPCIAKELKIKEIPNPKAKPDWVLIKSKALGISKMTISANARHYYIASAKELVLRNDY